MSFSLTHDIGLACFVVQGNYVTRDRTSAVGGFLTDCANFPYYVSICKLGMEV